MPSPRPPRRAFGGSSTPPRSPPTASTATIPPPGPPPRPPPRLFYAQEKAELEKLLQEQAGTHPELGLYMLRPPIVLGPHTMGAKAMFPGPIDEAGKAAQRLFDRLPVRLPVPAPDLPVQLIHEADVGDALRQCIVAAGPPGVYNIAADGILTGREIVRELGLQPVPLPGRLVQTGARLLARVPALPFVPPAFEWVEAVAQPAIMDTAKARRELGWNPRYSALEALRSTLGD